MMLRRSYIGPHNLRIRETFPYERHNRARIAKIHQTPQGGLESQRETELCVGFHREKTYDDEPKNQAEDLCRTLARKESSNEN